MAEGSRRRPICASSRKMVCTTGDGCAPKPISACRRANASRRSARSHHGRRESLSVRPRCAVQMARIAGQGRKPAARRLHGARADHQQAQEVQAAELHSGNCRHASSAPTPKPTPSAPCGCSKILNPILDRENTRAAYRLECDLLPMVLEMRWRGVRIDVAAAEQARDLLLAKRDAVLTEISDKLGTPVSMDELAAQQVAGRDLRSRRHQVSAHRERQSIVHWRTERLDGPASALAAAAHS